MTNEYLEWKLVSPGHKTPYALLFVRPDDNVSWAVLHAERPLEVRGAHEPSAPSQFEQARDAAIGIVRQVDGDTRLGAQLVLNAIGDLMRGTKAQTFLTQPRDCKHERAAVKCPDCGIDIMGARTPESRSGDL